MTPPVLTAVIVAWNSGNLLAECIGSLRRSARLADASIGVVVVDNASEDPVVRDELLLEHDILVRNPINAGYGPAAAQGAALATSPWLAFVNPDVVVAKDFVPAILDAVADAAPNVATLVPDMRYRSTPSLVNCRGITVDEIGVPAELSTGLDAASAPAPASVFGGSTGCCCVKSSALRAVGGFEPAYFAYLDDVDLAWRLQRSGYRAVYVPHAIAWHEGSASSREGSPLKGYLVARNRRLLFRLNGPRTIRARLWRTPVEVGHMAVTAVSSRSFAPVTGRLAAWRLRHYAMFRLETPAPEMTNTAMPSLAPRARLLETLRRKRAARREISRY